MRFMSMLLLTPALAGVVLAPLEAASEGSAEKVVAALPELEKLVTQIMKQSGVPGMAIAVVHKDKTVYLKGFGVRRTDEAGRVDEDTVFLLASVSKPITSTLLALLVGQQMLGWDDRLIDLDAEFRLDDPYATREATGTRHAVPPQRSAGARGRSPRRPGVRPCGGPAALAVRETGE
jgi:CubicO group peptidase (beta-lactamase class C family)